ncbi:ABC-type transport auxiliary lipoprotein family protein [Halomonas llamarensis]|uniref:ABC-type transport auxiliary lipoprotein family protein n=1 Tax=Halomonas llamarensis TaxID=2945104 RepID=A0ABT0SSQ8_9GAMM|nr:ABC-type transport auxiliary lipoprotein family protein [Halomonas llamarensis]MCL7930865.1 ABC-type transport auxiliary lipoprotein family protein [Halomonas llamarensis]
MRYPKILKFPSLLLLIALLISGCSVLPETTPNQLYRLPAPGIKAIDAPLQPVVLSVLPPAAGRLLGSDSIVVWPHGNQVSVYGGARWYEDAPAMLQSAWIEAIQQSAIVSHVSADRQGVDYQLTSELRDFHIVYTDGTPLAVMRVDLVLQDSASGERLATTQLQASQAANNESVDAVVNALGIAAENVNQALVQWLYLMLER